MVKPKNKKKKFIQTKDAVSFRVVHRSQDDPLIGTDAGEHVLAPIGDHLDVDPEERKVEQRKYGILYDDDYDYLQHLRDANEVYTVNDYIERRYRINKDGQCIDAGKDLPTTIPATADEVTGKISKLQIPSSVLETPGLRLERGLLDQAGPGPLLLPDQCPPELDPEVLAALDDDFDFENPENQLEDDFVSHANARKDGDESDDQEEEGEEEVIKEEALDDLDDCESNDTVGDLDFDRFAKEETRSRFTNYSVTSSVMRRTAGLLLIDDKFERLYEQYDDDEIGDLEEAALESEGLESGLAGHLNPNDDRMLAMAKEFEDEQENEKRIFRRVLEEFDAEDEEARRKGVREDDDGNGPPPTPSELVQLEPGKRERWDSTYSNLYNHPRLIKDPPSSKKRKIERIVVDPKTGLPKCQIVSKRSGLKAALQTLDHQMDTDTDNQYVAPSLRSGASRASTIRPKDETPEQRRARKKLVKEERRERRVEKKANTIAFKEEQAKIIKSAINARQTRGIKL